jgi:hypothetical protein
LNFLHNSVSAAKEAGEEMECAVRGAQALATTNLLETSIAKNALEQAL